MAKHWPDEQKSHNRRLRWMRRRRTLKSETCTERAGVYAAGISVTVSADYPGRSLGMPLATSIARCWDVCGAVGRDHSRPHRSWAKDRTEERQQGLRPSASAGKQKLAAPSVRPAREQAYGIRGESVRVRGLIRFGNFAKPSAERLIASAVRRRIALALSPSSERWQVVNYSSPSPCSWTLVKR